MSQTPRDLPNANQLVRLKNQIEALEHSLNGWRALAGRPEFAADEPYFREAVTLIEVVIGQTKRRYRRHYRRLGAAAAPQG